MSRINIPQRDIFGRVVAGGIIVIAIGLCFVPADSFGSISSIVRSLHLPEQSEANTWVVGIGFVAIFFIASYLLGTINQKLTFGLYYFLADRNLFGLVSEREYDIDGDFPGLSDSILRRLASALGQHSEEKAIETEDSPSDTIPAEDASRVFKSKGLSLSYCKRYVLIKCPQLYARLESVENDINLYTAFILPMLLLAIVLLVKTVGSFHWSTLLICVLALVSFAQFTRRFVESKRGEPRQIIMTYLTLRSSQEKMNTTE